MFHSACLATLVLGVWEVAAAAATLVSTAVKVVAVLVRGRAPEEVEVELGSVEMGGFSSSLTAVSFWRPGGGRARWRRGGGIRGA